jgi:hypothetical protein
MSVLMVRSKVRADAASEIEAAARRMFEAIEQAKVAGIRYASCRTTEGLTYIALLEVRDGVENPLPSLPAFREFQESLKNWLAEPPVAERLEVIGSYRLFD